MALSKAAGAALDLDSRPCYNPVVTREELLKDALNLPPEQRARLARDIISSLDGASNEGTQRAWVNEIERRVREVRACAAEAAATASRRRDGTVELSDWPDVRRRIEERLSSGK